MTDLTMVIGLSKSAFGMPTDQEPRKRECFRF
jgi:hypothetical protein